MKWNLLSTAALCGVTAFAPLWGARPGQPAPADVTEGELVRLDRAGEAEPCPLKHTTVKADITGFIARVNVTQEFVNPTKEKIEAVYKFPLPAGAAVDAM